MSIKIYAFIGIFIFISSLCGVFFYQKHRIESLKTTVSDLTIKLKNNDIVISETKKALEENKQNFETYRSMIEENIRRLQNLESVRHEDRIQIEILKNKVNAATLRQSALTDVNHKKNINEQTKKLVDDFKELTK